MGITSSPSRRNPRPSPYFFSHLNRQQQETFGGSQTLLSYDVRMGYMGSRQRQPEACRQGTIGTDTCACRGGDLVADCWTHANGPIKEGTGGARHKGEPGQC